MALEIDADGTLGGVCRDQRDRVWHSDQDQEGFLNALSTCLASPTHWGRYCSCFQVNLSRKDDWRDRKDDLRENSDSIPGIIKGVLNPTKRDP